MIKKFFFALAFISALSVASPAFATGSLDPETADPGTGVLASCSGPEDGYYVYTVDGDYQQDNSCGNAFNNGGTAGTGHVIFMEDYGSQGAFCGSGQTYDICLALGTGIVNVAPYYVNGTPPPPPGPTPSFAGLIAAANTEFGSTTGFSMASAVGWVDDSLIKLFIGSGMAVLYNLRWWIVALLIIGGVIYFAMRRLQFLKV